MIMIKIIVKLIIDLIYVGESNPCINEKGWAIFISNTILVC